MEIVFLFFFSFNISNSLSHPKINPTMCRIIQVYPLFCKQFMNKTISNRIDSEPTSKSNLILPHPTCPICTPACMYPPHFLTPHPIPTHHPPYPTLTHDRANDWLIVSFARVTLVKVVKHSAVRGSTYKDRSEQYRIWQDRTGQDRTEQGMTGQSRLFISHSIYIKGKYRFVAPVVCLHFPLTFNYFWSSQSSKN